MAAKYEEKGGDYKPDPNSKNQPKKGLPEGKKVLRFTSYKVCLKHVLERLCYLQCLLC